MGRISPRVLVISGIVLGVLVLAGTGAILLLSRPSVRVPSLVGATRASADARAKALGLTLVVKGTELAPDIPKGSVASQDPTAGVLVSGGSSVTVLISAGADTIAVPDTLGMTLADARDALRAKGLDVIFDTAASSEPTGTVIASTPAPGAKVASGDIVRLTIAGTAAALPTTDLTRSSFVIDPAPPVAGETVDIAYEVATRLSTLLRTAGARTTLTRSAPGAAGAPSEAARIVTAKDASATVLIGLSVASSGLEGMQVLQMPSAGVPSSIATVSIPLADAVLAALRTDFSSVSTITATNDAVLKGAGMAGLRVRLGSAAVAADRKLFADPNWADKAARAIFRGLSGLYGTSS